MAPPRVISFSELSTARQCPLKHELAYVDRWFKPQPPDSALFKGTWWHRALETHYLELLRQQRQSKKKRRELKLARACVGDLLGEQCKDDAIRDLVWWMYTGYIDHYGTDDEWQILAVEHSAQVRLPTLNGNPSQFILKIKVDLIVRDRTTKTKNLLVVDHKSGKDLPKKKELELDDQFGLYSWGLRQLGHKVFAQRYNAARTLRLKADIDNPGATPLDERFQRVGLYRTDQELNEVALEAYLAARTRYREQTELRRAGHRSPRATEPQTCSWKCDFKEACLAGRKGMDIARFLRGSGFTQDYSRH